MSESPRRKIPDSSEQSSTLDRADLKQFEELRARLAAIVEWSDDAIVSKTLDGVITSWNRGAQRMFGWTPEEAVGRHISIIIPSDRRSEEDDVLSRIRRGEIVDHYETVRISRDGQFLDISLTVSPMRDSTGRIIGASKIARDITDRKRLEFERERLLESETSARREAEAASRAKDQFMATVSHELRTPLNAILGWARLLQSGHLEASARAKALEVIVNSATTQAKLVEDLLDLSGLVGGGLRLKMESCSLAELVDTAVEAVRLAALAKGLQLETRLDEAVGSIPGSPDRLRQVVWNLVMNAIKFTPPGGRIVVGLTAAGPEVELSVEDTGEGIGAAALPFIFEPFRQEDASSTRRYGGLGLGLALVRHLVELHGGTVRAESPGKGLGARFTIRLPRPTAPQGRS